MSLKKGPIQSFDFGSIQGDNDNPPGLVEQYQYGVPHLRKLGLYIKGFLSKIPK